MGSERRRSPEYPGTARRADSSRSHNSSRTETRHIDAAGRLFLVQIGGEACRSTASRNCCSAPPPDALDLKTIARVMLPNGANHAAQKRG